MRAVKKVSDAHLVSPALIKRTSAMLAVKSDAFFLLNAGADLTTLNDVNATDRPKLQSCVR